MVYTPPVWCILARFKRTLSDVTRKTWQESEEFLPDRRYERPVRHSITLLRGETEVAIVEAMEKEGG